MSETELVKDLVNRSEITASDLVDLSEKRALLKRIARQMPIDSTLKLIGALQAGLKLAEDDELKRMEEVAVKETAAIEIVEKMAEAGLTFDDISTYSSMSNKKIKTRSIAKVEPKYRIEVDGETHEWTGRGRAPRVFADFFEAHNVTKKDVAI